MEVYLKKFDWFFDLEENYELYDRFYEKVYNRVSETAGDWIVYNKDEEGWVYFIDKITIEDEDLEYTIYIEGQWDDHGECGMYIQAISEETIKRLNPFGYDLYDDVY